MLSGNNVAGNGLEPLYYPPKGHVPPLDDPAILGIHYVKEHILFNQHYIIKIRKKATWNNITPKKNLDFYAEVHFYCILLRYLFTRHCIMHSPAVARFVHALLYIYRVNTVSSYLQIFNNIYTDTQKNKSFLFSRWRFFFFSAARADKFIDWR